MNEFLPESGWVKNPSTDFLLKFFYHFNKQPYNKYNPLGFGLFLEIKNYNLAWNKNNVWVVKESSSYKLYEESVIDELLTLALMTKRQVKAAESTYIESPY